VSDNDWDFRPLAVDSDWTWQEAVENIQAYYEERLTVVRGEREVWRRQCLRAKGELNASGD
jgi:hypothetical protein